MEVSKKKKGPKKPYCFLTALLALFISVRAEAQTVQQDLVGLGMKPELAEYIAGILPAGSVAGNDTYIKGRNQANSADINMLKIDSSDNTVINSSASDLLILQLEDNSKQLISFDATADTLITMTFGDGGTTAAQQLLIGASTADGDDDAIVYVTGGGNYNTGGTRGSGFRAQGNETSGEAGDLYMVTGVASGSDALMVLNHSASTFGIAPTSTTPFAVFDQDTGLEMATGKRVVYPAAVVLTPSTNLTPIAGSSVSGVVHVVATAAATANSYVNLPVATANIGKEFEVVNKSAITIKLQPDSADSVGTGAAAAAFSCTTGAYCKCRAVDTTLWGCGL